MKNYFSKSFISALMICSVVNTGLQANDAPVTVGYESATPFTMPTYQPQQPTQFGSTPSAPLQQDAREVETGNAIKRGFVRGLMIPEIVKGYIHKWTGGNAVLSHKEEQIEFITKLITTTVLTGGNVSAISATLAQSYPLINASTIEQAVICLAPAILTACTTKTGKTTRTIGGQTVTIKTRKANATLMTLAYACANLLAAKKMHARQEEDPSIEAWQLKQSHMWWAILYAIPCAIAAQIAAAVVKVATK